MYEVRAGEREREREREGGREREGEGERGGREGGERESPFPQKNITVQPPQPNRN